LLARKAGINKESCMLRGLSGSKNIYRVNCSGGL
jgi:hypothetical protein